MAEAVPQAFCRTFGDKVAWLACHDRLSAGRTGLGVVGRRCPNARSGLCRSRSCNGGAVALRAALRAVGGEDRPATWEARGEATKGMGGARWPRHGPLRGDGTRLAPKITYAGPKGEGSAAFHRFLSLTQVRGVEGTTTGPLDITSVSADVS